MTPTERRLRVADENSVAPSPARKLHVLHPGRSTNWRDAWRGGAAPDWLALTAMAADLTPELVELTAATAGVQLTTQESTSVVRGFVSSGLADDPDADGPAGVPTAPQLRPEVRQAMLAELDASEDSQVERYHALVRAGLYASDPRLASQLAVWAGQSRDWEALDAVWMAYEPTRILVSADALRAFADAPKEQRQLYPALSIAHCIVAALDPQTGDFDVDSLVKALVQEGQELHAHWSLHAGVDAAVLAGILWMVAQGSVAGTFSDPSLGGAWDTHLAVKQLIADRTRQGDAPAARTLVAYHAMSCGMAVLRSDWGQASVHGELGTTLSPPGDIFGLVAQAAWATICLVTGNSAEFQRAIASAPKEAMSSESMKDLLGMATLVRANIQLERAAAEAVLHGRDLMGSWLRWFNYVPMFIANRAQAAILWGDPSGALAEFDSSLPGGSLANAGSYWGPVLLRTRAELLLNVEALDWAEAAVATLLDSADRAQGLVPGARLQLMLGNNELAISLADEGNYAVEAPLADRAQLHVIKAAAMLKGGAERAVVRRQLTSACLICRDAGSALGFAMLPPRHRGALLDLGHADPDGSPCIVAETVARGAFDDLRQNCDRRSDLAEVKLTRREQVLLPLLLQPLTIQEVADSLFVSANTVRKQVVTLRQKLGASSRAELVARATELGIGTTSE